MWLFHPSWWVGRSRITRRSTFKEMITEMLFWEDEKRWNYIASCWDSNSYCSYSKVFICYSVAIFISPMLSFPPCTAASITDPHFTSCTRLTTYIYFLQHVNVRSTPCPPHLNSPSHNHPQSAKNVFFPPPQPSLPITNHTSYRIITQLLRAYHVVPASAPHPTPRLRNANELTKNGE